jgi:hypothetical protein
MTQGNPYRYDAPVDGAQAFFGRQAELTALREAIEGRDCVSFVGGPRSGLTSLLLQIASHEFRELCEASCGPVRLMYLQCATYSEPLSLVADLLARIEVPAQGLPNWNTGFSRLLAALDQLSPERLVIGLDDFEYIGGDALFGELIERLRALTHRVDMTLITATHTELKNCCYMELATSPFPNLFHVRYLGPFTPDEAEAFISATSDRSGVDLTTHAARILDLAGTHPSFLQMACWHYYEAILQGHLDHQVIAERFLQAAQPDLEAIWNHLEASERGLLARLAAGYLPDAEHQSQELVALSNKGYVRWPPSSPQRALFSATFQRYVLDKVESQGAARPL